MKGSVLTIDNLRFDSTRPSRRAREGVALRNNRAWHDVVQAKIMKFGSEFGLIVPKEVLDACGFGQEASITVQGGTLIVAPSSRQPRAGWEEALSAIPQRDLDRVSRS